MRVAIIGAGLAGLTVASELTKKGLEVEVFEKSRGLGGRLAVKRFDWGALDIGAQYFTARDDRFITHVEQWLGEGIVSRWDFTPYKVANGELVASPDDTLRYVANPGMNAIAHALARNTSVHLGSRITKIERTDNKWTLVAGSNGEKFINFDWLVCSAPPEQSHAILAETSIASRISLGALLPCRAVGLRTRNAVDESVQGIFGDDKVSWVSRLSSKRENSLKASRQSNLWMVHFSPEWSREFEQMEEVAAVREAEQWLNQHLRSHLEQPLITERYYDHFWRYATLAPANVSQNIIVDKAAGVAVVGDWVSGGRIEGAYLAALNLVDSCF